MIPKRIEELSKTFQRVKDESNNFSPQINGKNIQLLAGVLEGNFAIAIVGEYHDISLKNTNLIEVSRTSIKDAPALVFVLRNSDLLDIFISFTADLETLIQEDDNVTIVELYNRFLYWQTMFKVEKGKISEEKIKGLINELYILKHFLIPKYGVSDSLKGWTGVENTHKDFSYNDYWYEVKAVNFGKEVVEISSIEQLDSINEGQLLVSYFEKTSPENENGVCLIDLLSSLQDKIEYENQSMDLFSKVVQLGIGIDVFGNKNHEVNQYRYIIHGVDSFLINDSFPRLNKSMLPDNIGKVSYQLILAKIKGNKINFK